MGNNSMLTRKEAAEKLGISERTLDRYLKAGRIKSNKYDRAVRISKNEIDRFLQESVR